MSKYIKAEDVREKMYHEAFETDTDMQKWDSGCWIRYKLFENVIESVEGVDVEKLRAELHRLRNNHCFLCGGEEAPHGGRCDSCRWRSGAEWESL